MKGYVNDMKYVFTKEGASSLGGFGTIGGLFPSVWDWRIFWERTAFSIYHLGVHEYLADSGLGWRTRDVLDL